VRAFDLEAMPACRPLFPAVAFCENPYEAAAGADALVILTEWNQFRKLVPERLHAAMRKPSRNVATAGGIPGGIPGGIQYPLVVDLRNLYEPEKMAEAGLRYVSIGRAESRPGAAGRSRHVHLESVAEGR